MSAARNSIFSPSPSRADLLDAFQGMQIHDAPTPAAIIDRAVVERNCERMQEACQALDVEFRAHTKTHKTTEATKLQLGETTNARKVVVSTLAEAENVAGHLSTMKEMGKTINILYGIPLPPSQIPRLANIQKRLGSQSLSVLVDHLDQISGVHDYVALSGNPLQIFLKIDMGYHRAGLSSESKEFQDLVTKAIALEDSGAVQLIGFYCHAGHSYGDDSETASLKLLIAEIESLEQAAARALKSRGREPTTKLILSVGATPTATSIQALIHPASMQSAETGAVTAQLEALISRVKETYTLEVHAGVYPFLDMQQLATRSSSSPSSKSISTSDIAITILTEVCSLYPHREPPEALIAAGSLALGREPCKSYPGWGVVSDWGFPSSSETFHQNRSGWQVGRISQEHGILTADPMAFDGDGGTPMNLKYGQKVRVWPNHACIAGAMFGFYLVVDSRLKGREDEILDVWVRWRGW